MRSLMLLSTAAIVAGVRTSPAQEIRWTNTQGGSWNIGSNWEGGEIPDSFQKTAVIDIAGPYTIEFDRSTLLAGVRQLNPESVINMHAGDSAYLAGVASAAPFTVNGLLNVNPAGENRWTEIGTCGDPYYYDYDLTANGSGTIRLNAHPDNLDSARIGSFCSTGILHVGEAQTIAGSGRLHIDLYNFGAIVADQPGRVLELRAIGNVGINLYGELRAEGGGILRVRGGLNPYLSLPSGRIIVGDAQSAIEWNGTSINETIIDNSAGGTSAFLGMCRVDNTTLYGPHGVAGGGELTTARFTNNGTLILPFDGPEPARLAISGSSVTIGGSGTIFLNGTAALPTLGRITPAYYAPDAEMRLGTGQTLAGTGQVGVDVVNSGTLSPGGINGAVGLIELQSTNWTQNAMARLVIDVAGRDPSQFDRVTRIGDLTLAGVLTVRLGEGFTPSIGDEFVIMSHQSRSGAFSYVDAPLIGAAGWRVRYEPTATILTLVCATDFDGDGRTGLSDLAILLANFGTSGPGIAGDVNGDSAVALQDLSLLLGAFGESCP